MIKLSVVIITYNEEKNIAKCLDQAQKVADEVVVVDSFSKDKTKDICLKYPVKFIENPFEGHIQQKNFAAHQASFNHILSIDADEVLSPELIDSILRVKANFTADGYYFYRITNYCGKFIKHCGWYPDKQLRLFNKTKGSWGGQNPHDKYLMNPNARIEFIKGNLWHYSFHSIEQHVQTIDKFSSISAQQKFIKGKKPSYWRILFKPLFKFILLYVFKLGFLDGYYGFIICKNSAFSTYLKEVKLNELTKQK